VGHEAKEGARLLLSDAQSGIGAVASGETDWELQAQRVARAAQSARAGMLRMAGSVLGEGEGGVGGVGGVRRRATRGAPVVGASGSGAGGGGAWGSPPRGSAEARERRRQLALLTPSVASFFRTEQQTLQRVGRRRGGSAGEAIALCTLVVKAAGPLGLGFDHSTDEVKFCASPITSCEAAY
jgi:hypothetical protein